MLSWAALLLCATAPYVYAAAAAIPASEKTYPDVIPGPGLPSLASLGLTSTQLYTNLSTIYKRAANFNPVCGGGRGDTANVDDVIACFNYLQRIGSHLCTIPGNNNQHEMCHAGTAHVLGVDAKSQATTSICNDVALGVQWVFSHCNTNGQVEGSQAANGNGDLIVVVGGQF